MENCVSRGTPANFSAAWVCMMRYAARGGCGAERSFVTIAVVMLNGVFETTMYSVAGSG